MSATIRRASYYYVMVQDRPGEAYRLLAELASGHVSLLAFNAFPTGPMHTQLALFPEDPDRLLHLARTSGLALNGPHHAILIQGDGELGALASIHRTLSDAGINVYTAQGVADGRGGFGYLIYLRPEDFEPAARLLETA
jgi:hypothetical protein